MGGYQFVAGFSDAGYTTGEPVSYSVLLRSDLPASRNTLVFAMKKLGFILFLIVCALSGQAHSPQLSTITLIQNKDNTWNLMVGASLSAYQYKLADDYVNQPANSIQVADFRPLLLAHLRKSIRIKANGGKAVSLQNGRVVLGHQTDIRFDVTGMPEQIQSIDIQQLSFSGLGGHYCILKVITQKSGSLTSVLQQDNSYAVSLALQDDVLAEVAKPSKTNWLPWGAGAAGGLVLLLLIRLQRLKNQKKSATLTGNAWRQQLTHHPLPQA